ncbi:hypothetical protein GW17_00021907 [Ensete ventricosum]|nr:hypothetical protein GW17_00021907 [Ensete ventricosum]
MRCKSLYSGCCRSSVPDNSVALVAYPVVVRFHHARRPCAMMEIKAVIGETDMLQTMQQDALLLAGKALDLFDVNESTQIASFIKKLLLVYNSPEYRPKSVILKQTGTPGAHSRRWAEGEAHIKTVYYVVLASYSFSDPENNVTEFVFDHIAHLRHSSSSVDVLPEALCRKWRISDFHGTAGGGGLRQWGHGITPPAGKEERSERDASTSRSIT